MAEAGLVNDQGNYLEVDGPLLFVCCCCNSSKHDHVQLNCLHYYCRSCFDASNSRTQVLRSSVSCPACSETTEVSTVQTNSFLNTYKRASAVRDEIVLCSTCERKEKEEKAEVWCVDCAEALCSVCYKRHNKFITAPHRIIEVEYARTLPLHQLTVSVQCKLHNRAMESHCFTCCLPKCSECLESCSADSHDWHLLSDEVTKEHISSVTNRVRDSAKRLGGLLPGILLKLRAIVSRLRANRTEGHRMLVQHRRCLHDSTLRAFNKSEGEVCSRLQSTRCDLPGCLGRGIPRRCAVNIEALVLGGVRSLQQQGVRYLLKTVAASCCSAGRLSIIKLRQGRDESGSINVNGSVSLTSDIVLSACLGATIRRQAAPRAPLLFREASVSFKTTVRCWDVAATRDGHVLLAAAEHDLLVYSDRGQQLSSCRPERRSNGEDDAVICVAALSDGRAAVGVFHAQLVVLLKLSEAGDTWLEDRRVAVLQSPPWHLAAHGDLLAAAECRHDEQQQQRWRPGPELKLLRLSSGQVLYTQSRGYDIYSVELTALCVVTASLRPVQLSSGATAQVLDAFSHSGQFLWRYETSDTEYVWSVCVSADGWSRLYMGVVRLEESGSYRVLATRGADGRDCREVLSSQTHGLQLPWYLSLASGQQRTVLAVLNWDTEAKQANSVSMYEATDQ